MKILIVKLGAIGDIVHALPALAAIKRELPGAEVSWAAERRSAEILRGNPLIDNLIEVDTRALRRGNPLTEILPELRVQLRPLRRSHPDIAIDMQGLMKSAAIAKLSGAKKRFGFARQALREPASRLLLTDTIDIPERAHVIRKNLTLAANALGIAVPRDAFEFPVHTSSDHIKEAASISANAGGRFAVLNPAGGWVTKLWPAANFGQLADRLWENFGLRSIVVTGPGEDALSNAAKAASRSGALIAATPTLKGFFELAKRAEIYIGGDTGPTHLAIAAGAPIVGLFGPTEWWRNGSPRPDDVCVERTDITCRVDCHRRTCSAWVCMEISVEAVLSAVEKRLSVPAFTRI